MKEEIKRISGIEVQVKFEEQTEEISQPINISNELEEKILCQAFGKKRIFKDGQWQEVHYTELNIDDQNKVDFRIQVKSDFPPTKYD